MARSSTSSSLVARLAEPDVAPCDPKSKWVIRLRRDELTSLHEIEIRFVRRDGCRQNLRLPNSDRAENRKIMAQLRAFNARLPDDQWRATSFVEKLIARTPTSPVISPHKPVWRNNATGFVMPDRSYGSAKGTYVWDAEPSTSKSGTEKGSLEAYRKGVLMPAKQSTHASVGVLIGLAAALPGYVRGRRGRKLMPETALFHWAGDTSTGKRPLRA